MQLPKPAYVSKPAKFPHVWETETETKASQRKVQLENNEENFMHTILFTANLANFPMLDNKVDLNR